MTTSAQPPILEARSISKSYGNRIALNHVSFAARPGEIVGLLGPNGAGKTTTLSILSTLMQPDAGSILIDGTPPAADPRRLGRMLGMVPQSLAFYPTLSGMQNVVHFARMQGLSRSDATRASASVLEAVGLTTRAGDAARSYSSGMQRRLNLACGVVHRPAVLLLDEPTVGVDLQSREQILTLVRRLANASTAVIYSTHYMEEAERVCDRVLLIDRGELIADGTVEQLNALSGCRPRMELTYRGTVPEGWLHQLAEIREVPAAAGEGTLALDMPNLGQVNSVLERLRTLGVSVLDFRLHSPNLADAFLALTGRTLRDNAF